MNDPVYAWATIMYPLRRRPSGAVTGWTLGPWPVFPPGAAESVTLADRVRRYHVTSSIVAITSNAARQWHLLEPDASDLQIRCVELVYVAPGQQALQYLVVHADLRRGPRGGVSSMYELARLARLQSPRVQALMARLGKETGMSFEVDDSYMRASTIVGIPALDDLDQPPLVSGTSRAHAWLTAATDLPVPNEARYAADRREVFAVVPGVRGLAGAGGVAVAADRGRHLRERTFRAHYVDALLLAVVQRDALLAIAAGVAEYRSVSSGRRRALRGAFDDFRAAWWKPVAVDHPVSRVIGDTWRHFVGTDALMTQLTAEFADIHAERRTQRAELLAAISIVIAILAVTVPLMR